MKMFRAWLVLVAAALAGAAGMRADFVVVDYDGQTDWVRFAFVGWVRVEAAAKPARFAKGNAAVTLKVIEKLAGTETAPLLTLEHGGPPGTGKAGVATPAGLHDWQADLPDHREYFVFLERLGKGAYWCDDARAFPVREGRIIGLPGAYGFVANGENEPGARAFIANARLMLPALKVRVGRPTFMPPLMEKGRPTETPQQGYERVRAALQAGDLRELARNIHSPDGSAPKGLQALLQKRQEQLVAWPVQWQAVLEDKAVVILGPPNQPMVGLYLMRRGPRWLLLNTEPDTDAGRLQLSLLLTKTQFPILTAMLERELPVQ